MLEWLFEIRNFFLIASLAWIGISLVEGKQVDLEKSSKTKAKIVATINCDSAARRQH